MAEEPHQLRGGTLKVDLTALQHNWRTFRDLAAPAECGAAVKADAYGLGVRQVAPALWAAGCRTFFVALTSEALELRELLPDATIYVLNGLAPGATPILHNGQIRPCLCSLDEVHEWADYCVSAGVKLPAALHIESGINRLGLTAHDVKQLAEQTDLLEAFELCLVMSHLASGDDPDAASNVEQISEFDRLRHMLPEAPASLANSPGTLLGPDFHFDLVRPGVGLYGGNSHLAAPGAIRPVAHLSSQLIQIRQVRKGEGVGYGGTWRAARDCRIAVIPIGYADGYRRTLSSDPHQPDAHVWIAGYLAPVVGRVSMDMITVDVTDIPAKFAQRGAEVELLGANISADELAARAGTISYEIFTGLGSRFARVYSAYES